MSRSSRSTHTVHTQQADDEDGPDLYGEVPSDDERAEIESLTNDLLDDAFDYARSDEDGWFYADDDQ